MQKKILVISPTFAYPLTAGNRVRIHQLLLSLKNIGYEVHFLYINTEPFDQSQARENLWCDQLYVAPYHSPHKTFFSRAVRKLKRLLNWHAYTYLIDDWYDKSLDEFIIQLTHQIDFDVVMVEYVFFSKALECFGDQVLKIIDTHDVYTDRHLMYLENQKDPHWYFTTAQQEAKGLDRADIIIAIQENEKAFFSQLTDKKIVVVGHTVTLRELMPRFATTKAILFIGACNPMNIQGINAFMQHILPLVQTRFADVRLLLAGTICDAVGDVEACIKLGQVEDLETAYELADVVINPIPYGTGLKIKTIEALGYAKPLVTTSVGADGLEVGKDKAFLVSDTPEEFAEAIIQLFSNDQFARTLCRNAYQLAQQWNEKNFATLVSILG